MIHLLVASIKEVVVGDIKKVTIAVNKPEPKSSIGAGSSSIRRTGSIRFSEVSIYISITKFPILGYILHVLFSFNKVS